jgi:23S rRNA (cytosine1962-C5)-methyltransferase
MTARPKIILRHTSHNSFLFGHPWIYRSQIKETSPGLKPGGLADVFLTSKQWIGMGYFNPQSEISVRLLTRRQEPIDKNFFKAKFEHAIEFRKKFVKDTNAWRLVSSEADGLPGLIVDQYGPVLVAQFLTRGMEHLREPVLEALDEVAAPKGIYEKSDSSSRKIEGLEPKIGWIRQACAGEVVVVEKDLQFPVRFGGGQKTGFYLDQRENRLFLRELDFKGTALDAFCYTGGFGLHLAKNGWKVLGLDIQKEAISAAEENRRLNEITGESLSFKTANVFDELKILEKEKARFDLVILDPPSFVKKKQALEAALTGYKEILLRAMRILNPGGLLAVFSCSYHVDDNLLMKASLSAAMDTRKRLRALKFLKQSIDHPIDPFIPETYYLKGFLFGVWPL